MEEKEDMTIKEFNKEIIYKIYRNVYTQIDKEINK